jgi:uncharacterized protein
VIEQYGALPYRYAAGGEVELLLVTSRETGRWIVPKGNRVPGLSPAQSAAREAFEEGGLEGEVAPEPIGSYRYVKQKKSGAVAPASVLIYPMRVTRQLGDWPEKGQRQTAWFSLADAAASVAERSLRHLILSFEPPPGPDYPPALARLKGVARTGGFGMLRALRAIMPREDRFFDMFQRHADIIVQGADAMEKMLAGTVGIAESCSAIAHHEHAADDVTRDVLIAVRRSFITPFDRSAITALTSAMDTSLDEMWQTAKAVTLYEVTAFEPQMLEMSRQAQEASKLVREAIPLLRSVGKNGHRLHQITEQIVHLEGKADELHAEGLKALFEANKERPMAFIVGREVYSHIERVLDQLEDVADEIQGIVIDHA